MNKMIHITVFHTFYIVWSWLVNILWLDKPTSNSFKSTRKGDINVFVVVFRWLRYPGIQFYRKNDKNRKKIWGRFGVAHRGGHVTTFCPISRVWGGKSKIASDNPNEPSRDTSMPILGSIGPSVWAVGGGCTKIALLHFLICVRLYLVFENE